DPCCPATGWGLTVYTSGIRPFLLSLASRGVSPLQWGRRWGWVSDTIIPHPPARGCRCVPSPLAWWHRAHRVSAGYRSPSHARGSTAAGGNPLPMTTPACLWWGHARTVRRVTLSRELVAAEPRDGVSQTHQTRARASQGSSRPRGLASSSATRPAPPSSAGPASGDGPNIARLSFGATAGASSYKRLCRKHSFSAK